MGLSFPFCKAGQSDKLEFQVWDEHGLLSGFQVDFTPGLPGSDRVGPRIRSLGSGPRGTQQPSPGTAPPHLPLFLQAPPSALSSLSIGWGAGPERRAPPGAGRRGAGGASAPARCPSSVATSRRQLLLAERETEPDPERETG